TFGPRSERDYSKKVNRKVRQSAFRMSLTGKVADEKLLLIEDFGVAEGKTKEFTSVIKNLPKTGKLLVVTDATDEKLRKSVGNIPGVRTVNANSMGIMDVLQSDALIMTPATAEKIGQAYATES